MSPKQVFVREATGLVRDISTLDVFQYNVASFNGPITALTIVIISPLVGGWPIGWMLFGTVTIFFTILTYNMLAAAMPRTGGDYIYVSRILHPSLGLAIAGIGGFLEPAFFLGGIFATGWIASGVSPFLLVAGLVYNNPGLTSLGTILTVPTNTAIIGVIGVLIFTLICGCMTTRKVMKIVDVLMLIGTIVAVLCIVILFLPSNSQFIGSFNSVAKTFGTSYSGVITSAASSGWFAPGYNTYNSMLGSVLVWESFCWILYSTTLGGEVKSARRSLLFGNMSTLAVWFFIISGIVLATTKTVGQDFLSASEYLQLFNPASWKFPLPTSIALFAGLVSSNPLVSGLMAIGFGCALLAGMPWSFLQISRYSFALSFDRVFPASLSDVNERFHTPLKSIILSSVLGILVVLFFIFPITAPLILFLTVGIVPGCAITWAITSLAAVLFPYRAKTIFDLSPYKRRIAGIPLVSIVGAISTFFCVLYVYLFLRYPTDFGLGTSTIQAATFMGVEVGTIVVFFLLFFIIRAYRKSQGLNLDLAFKEIPPE
jgi:amino acid transporter